jgi:EpsI family protein
MNAQRRKALVALLGMGAAAALAKAGVPTKKIADQWETDLETMFPAQFGDWQVDTSLPVILPAPDVQAKLDAIYNQVLARTYVNRRTGERVMLSVAYGGDQSDGMSVHLPEVCYPAQGFQLLSQSTGVLSLRGRPVPVKRLETRLGTRYEPITYWLTLGETVAAGRTARKIQQMRYGLQGLVVDGMLIRVSTTDRDRAQAFASQDNFLGALMASLPEPVLPRLIGRARDS